MDDRSNTYLGPYKLCEIIGRGSMTTVYKAYQPSLHRFVAIKLLQLRHPQVALRFEREAQASARLQHPNILPVYDYGEHGDLRYLVMQYIEGSTTLSDVLRGQPLPPVRALHLISTLLQGLAYAHSRGVIHRDIKPSNVLLPTPDWPVLSDFGIAKLVDDEVQLTGPGELVGTAAYIAPERARGASADARADLYAVGIMLYELLAGRVPFTGPTPMAVLSKHAYEAPPSPRALNPALPAAIEPILLRTLAKDPDDRYHDATAMAAELMQVARQIESDGMLEALLVPAARSIPAHAPAASRRALHEKSVQPSQAQRPARRMTLGLFVVLALGGLLLGVLTALLLPPLSEGANGNATEPLTPTVTPALVITPTTSQGGP